MDKIVVEVDKETFDKIRALPHVEETYRGFKVVVYFDYDYNLVFVNKEAY